MKKLKNGQHIYSKYDGYVSKPFKNEKIVDNYKYNADTNCIELDGKVNLQDQIEQHRDSCNIYNIIKQHKESGTFDKLHLKYSNVKNDTDISFIPDNIHDIKRMEETINEKLQQMQILQGEIEKTQKAMKNHIPNNDKKDIPNSNNSSKETNSAETGEK